MKNLNAKLAQRDLDIQCSESKLEARLQHTKDADLAVRPEIPPDITNP